MNDALATKESKQKQTRASLYRTIPFRTPLYQEPCVFAYLRFATIAFLCWHPGDQGSPHYKEYANRGCEATVLTRTFLSLLLAQHSLYSKNRKMQKT